MTAYSSGHAMPDFLPNLFVWLWNLRYPESWVQRTSGFAIVLLVSAITGVLLQTTTPLGPGWSWGVSTAVAVSGLVAWAIARSMYWRSGSHRKIGVFFRAYSVKMDHWVELRTHLTRLLRQRELLEPVSIRCFPEAWVRDKRVLAKVRKRYGLSAVMHVTVSPESETSDKPRWRYAIELSGDNVPKEFAIATTAHARALIGREPSGIHLLELLHWRAGRLVECFLLHMAVLEYCEKRYESAAALLRALDESIGPRLSVDAPPRLQIRYLESLCLTDPSAFAGDAPPGPDELAHAIGRCEEAARRFGHQFSHVFARQGRNLYYAGRLDDALKMTERALSTARDDTGRVLAKLNIAVLQLLLANWKNAEASFRALFQETSWKRFAWDDLIGFADLAREHGYDQAVYLQSMYRAFRGVPIPAPMKEDLANWLNEDPSRTGLLHVYNEATRPHASSKQANPRQRGRREKRRKRR